MSYKIAIGSLDGLNVDLHFGHANSFWIYEIDDEGKVIGKTIRTIDEEIVDDSDNIKALKSCDEGAKACSKGQGVACGGQGNTSPKVELLLDCRAIVCAKFGFPIVKQFEKRAISCFDVECSVDEAITKISSYYQRVKLGNKR